MCPLGPATISSPSAPVDLNDKHASVEAQSESQAKAPLGNRLVQPLQPQGSSQANNQTDGNADRKKMFEALQLESAQRADHKLEAATILNSPPTPETASAKLYGGPEKVGQFIQIANQIDSLMFEEFMLQEAERPDLSKLSHLQDQLSRCRSQMHSAHHLAIYSPNKPSFIFFRKTDDDGIPLYKTLGLKNEGSKLHISVNRDQLDQALDAVTPLLLSKDNPFLNFKATNIIGMEQSAQDKLTHFKSAGQLTDKMAAEIQASTTRLTGGAQLTLYPMSKDPSFAGDGPAYKSFVLEIEAALKSAGVEPGVTPSSDATFEDLEFTSFRHAAGSRGEELGDTPITDKERAELKARGFYKEFAQAGANKSV